MVDLFGGAITVSVPSTWRDVSQVRQVPDNQEVYQDCTEETGAVLVFEILQYQSDVENSNACSFFLKDLADANEASLEEQQIHSEQVVNLLLDGNNDEKKGQLFLPSLSLPASMDNPLELYACISRGSQKVAQGKKGSTTKDAHWIDVELCVLRLKNVETDLLVSLSIPRRENDDSGEGLVADYHSGAFKEIVTSFNIRDW
eukprot:CAMPEP_0172318650 /NCGR_PEP_ID=MMETSP1058-20130122/35477_1 /TAXON_ID=83371 /ORGANISM="Detonula confervacea, Strain CCMP 353" /LENGTH=200 /DNA_ID=CAMNT_0013033529 /DNA_START=8 /DNA_END=607 /DNA_ORIENTATION=+